MSIPDPVRHERPVTVEQLEVRPLDRAVRRLLDTMASPFPCTPRLGPCPVCGTVLREVVISERNPGGPVFAVDGAPCCCRYGAEDADEIREHLEAQIRVTGG